MPQCTICGQETVFIPQYQQWYCHRCQRYPYMQQAQAAPYYPQPAYTQQYYYQQPTLYYPQSAYPQQYYQQPAPYVAAFQNPPAMAPTEIAAKARMNDSFMIRQTSDKIISTNWAWLILLFQIVFPMPGKAGGSGWAAAERG